MTNQAHEKNKKSHVNIGSKNATRGCYSHERALLNKQELANGRLLSFKPWMRGSNCASYTYREMFDMHLIYIVWQTAMGEKPCKFIKRNILMIRCRATHSLPFCIDDSAKPVRPTRTSPILVANEVLGQFLQKKVFSTIWSVIFQQVPEMYPETPISPNLLSAHCTRRSAYFSFTTCPVIGTSRLQSTHWICAGVFARKCFTASVLFTDEVTLSQKGVMNFHNLLIWADEIQRATRTHASKLKITLNGCNVGDYLLGPCIHPERLGVCIYLAFVKDALSRHVEWCCYAYSLSHSLSARRCFRSFHQVSQNTG